MIKRWTIFDTSRSNDGPEGYIDDQVKIEPCGTYDTREEAERHLEELFKKRWVSGEFVLILPTYHKA